MGVASGEATVKAVVTITSRTLTLSIITTRRTVISDGFMTLTNFTVLSMSRKTDDTYAKPWDPSTNSIDSRSMNILGLAASMSSSSS